MSLFRWFKVVLFAASSASAAIVPHETTMPNSYYFTSEVYSAESTDSTAVITVDFTPGSRSWTGTVGFATTNETAVANTDYTNVTGKVSWSSPGARSFNVPLGAINALTDRTVKLKLERVETNCVLVRAEATLIIRAAQPALAIASDAGNGVRLSWSAGYTNYVLESAVQNSGDSASWSPCSNAPGYFNGTCTMEFPTGDGLRLFRLRRVD